MPRRSLAEIAAASALPIPLSIAVAAPAHAVPRAPAAPAAAVSAATRVKDIGHRGAAAYAPENTLAAFRKAVSRRADYFELDVQQTKDHKLVVMHDATLARTTNAESVYPHSSPWRVRSFTLKQIKKLDAGSWFGKKYKGQRVPTLPETLSAMRTSAPGMLLEIKNPSLYPGMTKRIANALKADPAWLLPGRLIVHSFDWSSLRAFHKLLPSVPLGVIGTPSGKELTAVKKYADYVDAKYTGVTASYVKSVHKANMDIFAWTVDGSARIKRMAKDGVDGIITNHPGTVHSTLS